MELIQITATEGHKLYNTVKHILSDTIYVPEEEQSDWVDTEVTDEIQAAADEAYQALHADEIQAKAEAQAAAEAEAAEAESRLADMEDALVELAGIDAENDERISDIEDALIEIAGLLEE